MDSQVRGAGARHAVRSRRRVANKARGHAQVMQRGKHLLALLDIASQIAFAMNDQRWRLRVFEICDWRIRPKLLDVAEKRTLPIRVRLLHEIRAAPH